MDKLELAKVVVAVMHQFCGSPDVIDVSAADRFGEQVVVVTVPTENERDTVNSILPGYYENVRTHVVPLFGIGSLSKGSREAKEFESLLFKHPYNVYGTPEHSYLEELTRRVQTQDREVWASMDEDSRRSKIEKAIEIRRASFRSEFGICWLGNTEP